MQYGELKKNILIRLGEYSAAAPGMTEDTDIAMMLPGAVNEAVMFAFLNKNHKRAWRISQGEPLGRCVCRAGEHRNDALSFSCEDGYGYYFEVDDTATVNIYENGVPIRTIEHISTGGREYAAFYGRTSGGELTLEFAGDYYYKLRNAYIYNVLFSSDERVPAYSGYREHAIPRGLYRVENVFRLGEKKRQTAFKVVGDTLYLPEDAGDYEVESAFFPMQVTASTPDETDIEIPADAEYVVICRAAAIIAGGEDFRELMASSEQGAQMMSISDRGRGKPVVRRMY